MPKKKEEEKPKAKRGRPKKTEVEKEKKTEVKIEAKKKVSENKFIKNFKKKWGDGSIIIVKGGVSKKINPDLYISSGSKALNIALTGHPEFGWRKGRYAVIKAPYSNGKTTLALSAAVILTNKKKNVYFQDYEHALDLGYVESLGCDMNYFFPMQPSCAEEGYEQSQDIIKNDKDAGLIIHDSLAVMRSKAEIQGDYDDQHMGASARAHSQCLNKFIPILGKSEVVCLAMNQIKFKLGVFFGNPESTPCGEAPKFLSTYIVDMRTPRGNAVKERTKVTKMDIDDLDDDFSDEDDNKKKSKTKEEETATIANIKIEKNKVHPPFKRCKIRINYGTGIDKFEDTLSMLDHYGIVSFEVGKKTVGYNGKNSSVKKFKEYMTRKEFKKEIKQKLKKAVKG
jgi:recombination protein RecA